MAIDCTCNNTLRNLGNPDCPPVFQIAKKFIFVPRFDSTGAVNKILKTDLTSFANVEAKIEAADPLDRWYPTAEVENVEDIREEPVRQEFNSGKSIVVRDGFRTNTAFIPLGSTQELDAYKSYGCAEFGAYIVDAGGNIIYYEDANDPDYAYPILVDTDTYHAMLVKATDAEVQMVMLSWQWRQSQRDQNLRFVEASDLDYDIESLSGLFDVEVTFSNNNTGTFDTFTFLITTQFGVPVKNLVEADFIGFGAATADSIYNVSTGLDVAILTFTDDPVDGQYTITFAAQSNNDVMRLNAPIKDGIDFANLSNGDNDVTLT